MSEYVLYVFIDERKVPFYVGFTKNLKKRKREHLCEVRKGNHLYKYNKLRKVLAQNISMDDIMIMIEDNICAEDIDQKEIDMIKELRKNGYKLCNLTDGGEGGIHTSPDIIEKVRQAHLGKHLSEETKRKISESHKGMKFSDDHKKNLSRSWTNRVVTTETRQKMSKTSKGKINIKKFKLTDPEGKDHVTENGLTLFCEQHGLSAQNLCKVLTGERKNHKGWTIERINDGTNN